MTDVAKPAPAPKPAEKDDKDEKVDLVSNS